tara:strand:+ start:2900 stop:3052 length:153 start_codon:yes stop_codon:yes gene_type:complete
MGVTNNQPAKTNRKTLSQVIFLKSMNRVLDEGDKDAFAMYLAVAMFYGEA